MSDINYLLRREQISLLNARTARSPEARAAHRALAGLYAAALRDSSFTLATFQAVGHG